LKIPQEVTELRSLRLIICIEIKEGKDFGADRINYSDQLPVFVPGDLRSWGSNGMASYDNCVSSDRVDHVLVD